MKYFIFLDDNEIGWTELEYGDAPMGVAWGTINFHKREYGYNWLKSFCIKRKIVASTDYPEDKFITFNSDKYLKIKNEKGIKIKGVGGNQIEGMDDDKFYVSILGIAHPFYEEEFPHHVKEYNERFKK